MLVKRNQTRMGGGLQKREVERDRFEKGANENKKNIQNEANSDWRILLLLTNVVHHHSRNSVQNGKCQ